MLVPHPQFDRVRLVKLGQTVCLGCTLSVLSLQVRAGSEFQINSYTIETQYQPAISHDSQGSFVVVWASWAQDGQSFGVFAQPFDGDGSFLGSELPVNSFTLGRQMFPSISHDPSGGFVVIWSSEGEDGSSWGVFGQRFESRGEVGSEFQINTYTLSGQLFPAVSHDPRGNFIVVWASGSQDGYYGGIFARQFDSVGRPLGPEMQINVFTRSAEVDPAISHDSSGGFVIAWSNSNIYARRFDSFGNPLGSGFLVNTHTFDNQENPTVSHGSSGRFVIAWDSFGQDGASDHNKGIFAQRYESDGTPLGSEFQVNTFTFSYQSWPTIAQDPYGGFTILWQSELQDHYGRGVFGQRFDSSATPIGGELQVSTVENSDDWRPRVSVGPEGSIVAAWQGFFLDGSEGGIFGRRFMAPRLDVGDAVVFEGNSGTVVMVFTVQLASSAEIEVREVRVSYTTIDGSARAGRDYVPITGPLTIPPGTTEAAIAVTIIGDTILERTETLFLSLYNPHGAILGDSVGEGILVNDDRPWNLPHPPRAE